MKICYAPSCGMLLTRDGRLAHHSHTKPHTQHTGPMQALFSVAIEEASPRRDGRCTSVCRRIARTCGVAAGAPAGATWARSRKSRLAGTTDCRGSRSPRRRTCLLPRGLLRIDPGIPRTHSGAESNADLPQRQTLKCGSSYPLWGSTGSLSCGRPCGTAHTCR